eukprot:TRINITY_DN26338_c0_g1_i1.p1 TRINITY_DN26338_c0_g1~~TRINITY_DN26338_c0_g1_i1.p1  ORF type:complete len:391 (-),score=98.19 TRINITY_DN26338_c0_g1_i1:157-1329(-)
MEAESPRQSPSKDTKERSESPDPSKRFMLDTVRKEHSDDNVASVPELSEVPSESREMDDNEKMFDGEPVVIDQNADYGAKTLGEMNKEKEEIEEEERKADDIEKKSAAEKSELRTQLFNTRMEDLAREAKMIKSGESEKLQQKLAELEASVEERLSSNRRWRDQHHSAINHAFECERKCLEQERENDAAHAIASMLSAVLEEKKKMEQETGLVCQVDFETPDASALARKTRGKRQADYQTLAAFPASSRKKNAPTAVQIALSDQAIQDDLTELRKKTEQFSGRYISKMSLKDNQRSARERKQIEKRMRVPQEADNAMIEFKNGAVICQGITIPILSKVVVSYSNGAETECVITTITPGLFPTIFVREMDGTKVKLNVTSLRKGDIRIRPL